MKFALVLKQRIEATPKAKGECPGCGDPVIAKCGKQKIWHWAHKGTRNCDPWWEPETEWHRAWKANFPDEQQEVRHQDAETGEWHIADIKVASGLVLEFQHSAISADEIQSRESFYKKMVWIVDATRLKKTVAKLEAAFQLGKEWQLDGVRSIVSEIRNIPLEFSESRHVVLFDCGAELPFYCLLPGRVLDSATLCRYDRKSIIGYLSAGSHFIDAEQLQNQLTSSITELARKMDIPVQGGLDLIFRYYEMKSLERAVRRKTGFYGYRRGR